MKPSSSSLRSAGRCRDRSLVVVLAALSVLAAAGCDALGSVVVEAGDFAGAKADAHCDRRVVTEDGRPAAFCQEVVGTVAAAEFSDDCRTKHKAQAGPGLCPRAQIIAGCQLQKKNQDDSKVFDWYYVVGPKEMDSRVRNAAEVAKTCADRERYEEGAELAQP